MSRNKKEFHNRRKQFSAVKKSSFFISVLLGVLGGYFLMASSRHLVSLTCSAIMLTTMTHTSCLAKQERVKNFFSACKTPEAVYEKLIELGRALPPLAQEMQNEENLVSGCQSRVYLHAQLIEGKVQFLIGADALISAGLAALLLAAYNYETPEAILGCPPTFLEGLGIHTALTPGRSHGLSSIHLRMKQEAVKFLVASASK